MYYRDLKEILEKILNSTLDNVNNMHKVTMGIEGVMFISEETGEVKSMWI